ncbi:unnamed protein product [Ilex paraguariensis]|uniref:Uncharacterized protein n=1 Tax=Ilex paraguariensis TaxID=185542 RepID=A0ABC8TD24_9AQUA
MDPRRVPRTVSDPKVRQVGFFAPPDRSQLSPSEPSASPPVLDLSPSGNSLSPVMIPPSRHLSELPRAGQFPPALLSPLRRPSHGESIPVGSYNPSEFASPTASGDLSDDVQWSGRIRRGNSGKFASSLPTGGFDMSGVKANIVPATELTTVSVVNMPPGVTVVELVDLSRT